MVFHVSGWCPPGTTGLEDDFEDDDEAEAVDEEVAVPARRGGSNKKRLLILIVLPILLVVGAMAGAYFSGLADPLLHRMESGKKTAEDASKASQAPAFYDLPEILVNLDAEGSHEHFLKIQVSLELKSPLDAPKIEAVMPLIIDKFEVFLRELRIEDLQGSVDVLRIQEEMQARVNDAIKPVEISNVLIRDILVQ